MASLNMLDEARRGSAQKGWISKGTAMEAPKDTQDRTAAKEEIAMDKSTKLGDATVTRKSRGAVLYDRKKESVANG
jgi:hypothetical protein